jgi:hypothetical protein
MNEPGADAIFAGPLEYSDAIRQEALLVGGDIKQAVAFSGCFASRAQNSTTQLLPGRSSCG